MGLESLVCHVIVDVRFYGEMGQRVVEYRGSALTGVILFPDLCSENRSLFSGFLLATSMSRLRAAAANCSADPSSGSQRTTTTSEPLPLVAPVNTRVGMSRFVKSPLVTACLVTRL